MADDINSRVAAVEVWIKTHDEKLKGLHESIQDIYEKYGVHSKEFRDVLLQLQGILNEFTEFSVKLKELEEDLGGIPLKLNTHINDFNTYKNNDGFFKFVGNNKALSAQIMLAGVVMTSLIVLLSGSESGMAVLKFFAGLVGWRF